MESTTHKSKISRRLIGWSIYAGLTAILILCWRDNVAELRRGETTHSRRISSSGRSVVERVTWQADPVGFALVIVTHNLFAGLLGLVWLLVTGLGLYNGVDGLIHRMRTRGGTRKICAVCKSDCSDQERYKDDEGNYFCKTCYETRCMRCGRDCSGQERISNEEGYSFCPNCFAEMQALKADLEAQFEKVNRSLERGRKARNTFRRIVDI